MRRGPRALLFVALTGITVAAAGTLEGRELRPLMRGWEQLFALEYGLGQYRGQPAVEGYVINISPYGFTRIRILIDALDADDQVVAQRVAYVPGELGGRGRTIASNLSATRFVEGPAGIHSPLGDSATVLRPSVPPQMHRQGESPVTVRTTKRPAAGRPTYSLWRLERHLRNIQHPPDRVCSII